MKTDSTRVFLWRSILFVLLLLYSMLVFGQPDYDFRDKILVSGTDNQAGAVYRFNNVKPGVDAQVTLLDLTNGITLSDIDGGSGFVEALQPVINIPGHTSAYVEMRIDFLYAGTDNLMEQLEVPITPIDVDGYYYGDGFLYEYDMVELINGYVNYDMAGGELSVGFQPGWVKGTNTSAITYDGVDTVAKQVMFSVVNAHLSSIIIRVGADNQSSSTVQRLRSVYFKKFWYVNSILPVSNLLSFNGVGSEGNIKLNWMLLKDNTVSSIVLEKSYTTNSFQPIAEFSMNEKVRNNFSYSDTKSSAGAVFYRLKMITTDNKVQYSNTLYFKGEQKTVGEFSVYPSIVNSSVTTQVSITKSQSASFEIFSYAGNKVYSQSLRLQQGENNIRINDLDRLAPGQYISILRTTEKTYSTKINKL